MKYDNIITYLSRKIVYKIKKGKKYFTTSIVIPKKGTIDEDELSDNDIDLYFRIKVFIDYKKNLKVPFNVIGITVEDKPIEIWIEINPKKLETSFNDLIADIKGSIQHELTHFTQMTSFQKKKSETSSDSTKDIEMKDSRGIAYYTSPHEVPAFISGIRRQAKSLRKPWIVVAKEYLKSQKKVERLSDDDIMYILKMWLGFYSKKPSISSKFKDFLSEKNQTEKKFEDVLITEPQHKVLRFGEYRKGSGEYGQLFQDLMMMLRLKKEQNKDADSIILTKNDLKNIDYKKLIHLVKDEQKIRRLGMSFDVKLLNGGNIEFSNLGNKESRPWENNTVNEGKISFFLKNHLNEIKNYINIVISELTEEQKDELKASLMPYKNLSFHQLKNKIIKTNEQKIHSEFDPYGEENWDDNEDIVRDEFKLRKKIKLLSSIKNWTVIVIVTQVMGYLFNLKDSLTPSIIHFIAIAVPIILYFLVKKFYKTN